MSTRLQHLAETMTAAAGWQSPVPGDDGSYRFSLEGGLDFALLTPENRTGIFLADLGDAPEKGSLAGDEETKRLASVAAASLKKRRSSFAVAGPQLELSRTFSLQGISDRELIEIARDFINDLAWWKAQVANAGGKTSSNTSNSPFSFGSFGAF